MNAIDFTELYNNGIMSPSCIVMVSFVYFEVWSQTIRPSSHDNVFQDRSIPVCEWAGPVRDDVT